MTPILIIIPTYRDAANLTQLMPRIHQTLTQHSLQYETIIINDYPPDTPTLQKLAEKYPIHIQNRPRKMGKATALHLGFNEANTKTLLTINADLQHPPELILKMLKQIHKSDLVIASKYTKEATIHGWSMSRRIISQIGIKIIHLFLPRTRSIQDPVSGYYMLKRAIIQDLELDPRGMKLLIEIIIKANPRIIEIPYSFEPRNKGKSSLSRSDVFAFLRLVVELTFW